MVSILQPYFRALLLRINFFFLSTRLLPPCIRTRLESFNTESRMFPLDCIERAARLLSLRNQHGWFMWKTDELAVSTRWIYCLRSRASCHQTWLIKRPAQSPPISTEGGHSHATPTTFLPLTAILPLIIPALPVCISHTCCERLRQNLLCIFCHLLVRDGCGLPRERLQISNDQKG